MNNTARNIDAECGDQECDTSQIELLITPREKDLGGFSVRRVLPYARRRMVGPFIFFDHMGPAEFGPGEGIDVRPHPHINLATITYLFEGEIMHKDSIGYHQAIHPGAINLMTAGKGIVHSERAREEVRASGQRLHGLQLWIALPEEKEEIEPSFEHTPADQIPETTVDGVPARVMMGSAYGITSPVTCHSPSLYLEARLTPDQTLTLPDAEERAVYVAEGSITINGQSVEQYQMAVLKSGETVTIEATASSKVALIGGDALSERHIWWNFVSSRKERIEQAKADWKGGNFAMVKGDDEFIPLPEA